MEKIKDKKIFKSRLFYFILGIFLTSIIGVGATSLIYSKEVTYDNSSSGLSSTTVQGALDELYESAKNGGAKVSCNDSGECTVTCKTGNPTITDSGYSCTNTTPIKCPSGTYFVSLDSGYKCRNSTVGDKIVQNEGVITSGDGLYKDLATIGRYIYRGLNPNNYIKFNNETWRIISIENDGTLKIVRNEQLPNNQYPTKYQWDAIGNRNSSTSTYCTYASSYGCNAWAATKNLINSPNEFKQYKPNSSINDSMSYVGSVISDSTLLISLNGTYYNSLSSDAKSKVVKGTFNVSTPGDSSDYEKLDVDAVQEKQYQWRGYVSLYTVTELLRASTNSSCITLAAASNSINGPCSNNNWLWPSFYEWTLSPFVVSSNDMVWGIYSTTNAYINAFRATNEYPVRPVLHLSKDITLSGTGTSSDPYVIVS